MLNETASSRDSRPVMRAAEPEATPSETLHDLLQQMVGAVLDVEEVTFHESDADKLPLVLRAFGTRPTARFSGRLRIDSETAYDKLDAEFRAINHTPVFREHKGKHVVLALRGRIEPQPRAWWPNLILFVLTIISVLLVGTELATEQRHARGTTGPGCDLRGRTRQRLDRGAAAEPAAGAHRRKRHRRRL